MRRRFFPLSPDLLVSSSYLIKQKILKGKTMPRDVPSSQPERQRPIPIPTPQRQVPPQAPLTLKEKPSMLSPLPFFQRPLQPVPKVSPLQWRPSVPQSRPQKNRWLFIIGAILIIIVVGTGLALLFSSTDCGQDIECFYSLASECKTAKVTTVVSTATLALSARSCTLTKTITALSSDEPKAIQDLILKKAMKCTYSQGAFDKGYITGISTNLEACKGELKDALESVISA